MAGTIKFRWVTQATRTAPHTHTCFRYETRNPKKGICMQNIYFGKFPFDSFAASLKFAFLWRLSDNIPKVSNPFRHSFTTQFSHDQTSPIAHHEDHVIKDSFLQWKSSQILQSRDRIVMKVNLRILTRGLSRKQRIYQIKRKCKQRWSKISN